MKAEDARKLAASLDVSKRLASILEQVKSAATKGYLSATVSDWPKSFPEQRALEIELKILGYKVKQDYDQREGTSWVTVSWAN